MSDTPKVIPTAEHARNLEHQLAAARRERDDARAELQEYVTEFQGTSLRNAKSIRAMVDQLTAERDELMRRFTVIGRLIRKALPNICNPEAFPYERTLGIIREHRKLVAERDRLREDFTKFRANIRQALFSYWPNNLGNTDEEIVGAITRALTALATAQAEAAADKRRLDWLEKRWGAVSPESNRSNGWTCIDGLSGKFSACQPNVRAALDAASTQEEGK